METAVESKREDGVGIEYQGRKFDIFEFPTMKVIALPLFPEFATVLSCRWEQGEKREAVFDKLLGQVQVIERCQHQWNKRVKRLASGVMIDGCSVCGVLKKSEDQD